MERYQQGQVQLRSCGAWRPETLSSFRENVTEDINGANPYFHFAGLAANRNVPTVLRAGTVRLERSGLMHDRIPEMR